MQKKLIRNDSVTQNNSIVHAYDANGNILSKTTYPYTTGTLGTAASVISYVYDNSESPNQLTSYNGSAVTYTGNGEMQTYNGNTYTWGNHQLTGVTGSGSSISYTYNADGMRLSKTVNAVTSNFTLDGETIVSQSDGTNTIRFTYDSKGAPATVTVNGTVYTYDLNAQYFFYRSIPRCGICIRPIHFLDNLLRHPAYGFLLNEPYSRYALPHSVARKFYRLNFGYQENHSKQLSIR